MAYSRADGQVDAMLLQDGTTTIGQVYRDARAAAGWNTRVVAASATDMVAGWPLTRAAICRCTSSTAGPPAM